MCVKMSQCTAEIESMSKKYDSHNGAGDSWLVLILTFGCTSLQLCGEFEPKYSDLKFQAWKAYIRNVL